MNTEIDTLGTNTINSPIKSSIFTNDDTRIIYNTFEQDIITSFKQNKELICFEKAGARKTIFFQPSKIKAAIVSCGGLCPGINNVIRSLVMQLYHAYKVKEILGIRYGYQGLNPEKEQKPIKLNPHNVKNIHSFGGSILGSSRGNQPIKQIVQYLKNNNINILFTIGGDGTLNGAYHIAEEIKKQKLYTSVIGIPKTIDNDIPFIAKSFGFETAFSSATQSIQSAHTEAIGAPNCIGLVKLMGRHSGFIAANATLSLKEVNYLLVPEVDFNLDGRNGLLNTLKSRLDEKEHAVIVVAEGSGQKFFTDKNKQFDASGNIKLNDIGIYLKDTITSYFKDINYKINIKYIDPSYIIRSLPANPNDSIFCGLLAQNAVHAAMAGKTNMIIGTWNNMFTHIPIKLIIGKRKQINPKGQLWQGVLASTGQPKLIN